MASVVINQGNSKNVYLSLFSIQRIHFINKNIKAFTLSAAKHPKGAKGKVAHSAG